MPSTTVDTVLRYHNGTKHSFHQFARSLGYLDWASQPRPFRSYIGSPVIALEPRRPPPRATTGQSGERTVTYDDLFVPARIPPVQISAGTIGEMLRCSLGLSAWKVFGRSRWALRVNPSSGNLHPTEAYIVTGPLPELSPESSVWHYAPESHSIEQRCAFEHRAWRHGGRDDGTETFLVVLTSIHWRESWKYGERAFRYCQHDLGHAIGAVSLAAAMCGWEVAVRPRPRAWIAGVIGIDRDEDYVDAEREDVGCLMLVSASPAASWPDPDGDLADAARRGRWFGRASQLSEHHVQWTFIDEVADATRGAGEDDDRFTGTRANPSAALPVAWHDRNAGPVAWHDRNAGVALDARRLILQRRSAVALDGLSSIDRSGFLQMITRLLPSSGAPWNALWWTPRIHLAIFVHRVTGLDPGLYVLVRDGASCPRLRTAFDPLFEWNAVEEGLPLYRLALGGFRSRSQRLSCDQAIAADGFFSLAMVADFDRSLTERGSSFYRNLFWEAGVIGQVLYLEAEAAGARGTGIGCYYDDAVHETLGLRDHTFQSLYHFAVGMPVEDRRLTTEPGYWWG
ncbi:MAG: nitroreductase [Luteitalea sp.]|nr:nitroreductase [Luteitalea sp.]